jgi:Tfp pilus assembly protein PilF
MPKDRTFYLKTLFTHKIVLVFFGLFLFFVFLETGLRLGGLVFFSIQEHRNAQSIKQKGAYRILCLGESTTGRQYPPFLEKILNQNKLGVRFSIIDKGTPATNTSAILSQVESYLSEYHPDMVIAMMGINDWGKHLSLETPAASKGILFIRSFRTYKLARLLWLHILNKTREVGRDSSSPDKQARIYLPKIGLKEAFGEPVTIKDKPEELIESNPQDDNTYVNLGIFYQTQARLSEAEEAFKKASQVNPKNDRAYFGLGWIALRQGNPVLAEKLFQKTIELNPQHYYAQVELGWIYRMRDNFSLAEQLFKQAIEIDPKTDDAYYGLAALYQFLGKFLPAEEAFNKAIELNPKNIKVRIELGQLYLIQHKFLQAEACFKNAIEWDPENDSLYGAMSLLYEEMGKVELAQTYARKANSVREKYYIPITVNNYRKLKEILDRKKIKLVCVQYPLRSVEPLRKIFQGQDQGIIFVDNESVFKEALKKSSYKEYFMDMFGGEFGHCTDKGNRLLAKNIADTIIQELFSK